MAGERFRRIGRQLLAAALVAVTGLALHLAIIHGSGNLAEVRPGELFRSAQPDAAMLARLKDGPGLASVLNLRGAAPGAAWYGEETAASAALGLVHADFAMSASRDVSRPEAEALVALMRALPKPLLIHCRQGSDRTGLAVALYLAAIAGASEAEAEAGLSLRYGHFAVPVLSDAWPMDRSFEALEPWLGYSDS